MSSTLSLDEATAYLKKEGHGGTNLYDHLSEVLLKILVEKPDNSCDSFENISEALKQTRLDNNDSNVQDLTSSSSPMDLKQKNSQDGWCNAALKLAKPVSEEIASSGSASGVADLCDEATYFEWAGISFGAGETFRLSLSLTALAATHHTSMMRLWGKLLGGAGLDYYIAEGQLPEAYEPSDPMMEEGADGVNQLTYWALPDDGTYQWVLLPAVTSAQILAARQLKRFIGNRLNAPVLGHPPFPGTELNFIRATIARISASTLLAPAGFYTTEDEAGSLPFILNDDVEPKTVSELSDPAGWVHFSKELNATYGRMTSMPPKEDESAWENEVLCPVLQSCADDATDTWKCALAPVTFGEQVGRVAVLKSLVWPGAVTVGLGKKFINLYVGNGVKYTADTYQPTLPAELAPAFGVTSAALSEEPVLTEGKETIENAEEVAVSTMFTNLTEQADVFEDPTPVEAD